MTKRNLSAAICMIVSLGAGTAAEAQSDPASVELGNGVEFKPSLSFDVQSDDNLLYTNSDELDSVIAVIKPSFELFATNGTSEYSVNYSLSRGEYFDSEDDNYLDHFFNGAAKWELNAKNRLSLNALYTNGHEPRGTRFSEGKAELLDEPDTYSDSDLGALYSFGAEGAKGRIDVTVGTKDRDYDGGLRTANRDRGTDYGTVGFFYNAGGKTELFTEVSRSKIDYDATAANTETLNSAETDVMVGIKWEGTAATTGTAKIGQRQKDFKSFERKDFSAPRWEVGVRWSPLSYSSFDLNTERRSDESNGYGNFSDTKSTTLAWTHSWSEAVSSTFSYNFENSEYAATKREDDVKNSSVRLDYQSRRWLSFHAGLNISDKDSNVDTFDFEKNLVFVGLNATL
ncbi:outer membrane beta-barrel protein [Microbulbifer sp. CAU 1566]|uniref:outer membrane beta-barrel protein n=1 Tax=Microbulbifer sp. CAU 1566 TaxID=2933269 RepID=UPI002004C8F4|nr:outer membrane beta-barrel protein [Microbulbifer sp. CAU 1566]MCK7598396.1 outer membrane beta-barrel protein [Microbulbifer sp. CAU 1566]